MVLQSSCPGPALLHQHSCSVVPEGLSSCTVRDYEAGWSGTGLHKGAQGSVLYHDDRFRKLSRCSQEAQGLQLRLLEHLYGFLFTRTRPLGGRWRARDYRTTRRRRCPTKVEDQCK